MVLPHSSFDDIAFKPVNNKRFGLEGFKNLLGGDLSRSKCSKKGFNLFSIISMGCYSAVVTVRIVKTGNLHGNDTLSGLRKQFSSSAEALLQHYLRE